MKPSKRNCDIPYCFKRASHDSRFCIDHKKAENSLNKKRLKPKTK